MTNPINPDVLRDMAAELHDLGKIDGGYRAAIEACAFQWQSVIDHGAEEWGREFEASALKYATRAPDKSTPPPQPETRVDPSACYGCGQPLGFCKALPACMEIALPPGGEHAEIEEEAEALYVAFFGFKHARSEWPILSKDRRDAWARVARKAREIHAGKIATADREWYAKLSAADAEVERLKAAPWTWMCRRCGTGGAYQATETAAADAFDAHCATCEYHPMRELEAQIATLTRERDEARTERNEARARLRTTAQILVKAAGADGPLDAEDAADRLAGRYLAAQAEIERLSVFRSAPPTVTTMDVEAVIAEHWPGIDEGSTAVERRKLRALIEKHRRSASVEDVAKVCADAFWSHPLLKSAQRDPRDGGEWRLVARSALAHLGFGERKETGDVRAVAMHEAADILQRFALNNLQGPLAYQEYAQDWMGRAEGKIREAAHLGLAAPKVEPLHATQAFEEGDDPDPLAYMDEATIQDLAPPPAPAVAVTDCEKAARSDVRPASPLEDRADCSAAHAELSALRRDLDAARLMLRRLLPCVAIRGGKRAPEGKWIVTAMDGRDYRCDDDGAGLPLLTDEARAALRGAEESR